MKMKPVEAFDLKNIIQVFENQEIRIQSKKKQKATFKVGDYVRLSKAKNIFEKGFTSNWTEEIFRITNIDRKYMPIMYTVVDDDNEPVHGKFYKQELQKVNKPSEYAIEKVIRKKGNKSLVKFLGYKQTQWINTSDITRYE